MEETIRLREIECVTYDNTANKWQTKDVNPGPALVPSSVCDTTAALGAHFCFVLF